MDYTEGDKMSRGLGIDIPKAEVRREGHKAIQDGVYKMDRAISRLSSFIEVINLGSHPHLSEKEPEPVYLSLTDTLAQTPDVLFRQAESIHKLIDNLAELEKAVKPKTCKWSLVDGHLNIWSGQCGADWHLIEGTPNENEMLFCHRCGGKLIEIEPKD